MSAYLCEGCQRIYRETLVGFLLMHVSNVTEEQTGRALVSMRFV